MKKTLLFLLCFIFLLTACNGNTEDSSVPFDESSEAESESLDAASEDLQDESKKEWVEHDTKGDLKITREYFDGENDYKVTTEDFDDNDVLREKNVTRYINKQKTESGVYKYSADGEMTYSCNEIYGEEYVTREIYNCDASIYSEAIKVKSRTDKDNNLIDGTIEHYSFDGEKLSEGTLVYDDYNGRKCVISNVFVYGTDEYEPYFQTYTYDFIDVEDMYSYYECTDTNANTLFWEEFSNASVRYYVGGEYELTAEYVGDFKVFTDKNGKLVAEVDGMTLITIGEGYEVESTVEMLNEVMELYRQYSLARLTITW